MHNGPHFNLNLIYEFMILTVSFDHKPDEWGHRYKEDQQGQSDGETCWEIGRTAAWSFKHSVN